MQLSNWQVKSIFVHSIVPKPTNGKRVSQKPSYNFGPRFFAYQHLAEGLNRSLSAFSSFVGEDPDPRMKTDRCAHYVDDVVCTADDHLQNIEVVLQRNKLASLRLCKIKCTFGQNNLDFLGKPNSKQSWAPLPEKFDRFSTNSKITNSWSYSEGIKGFSQAKNPEVNQENHPAETITAEGRETSTDTSPSKRDFWHLRKSHQGS